MKNTKAPATDLSKAWSMREVIEQAIVLYDGMKDIAKKRDNAQGENFWESHAANARFTLEAEDAKEGKPPARKPVTFDIPEDADLGECRSCGEKIAWVITEKKKRMPVELATKESHFARCPEAAKWRKEKRA